MVFKPPLFDVVAKSPFKMLQKHMKEVLNCVTLLDEFCNFALIQDWDKSLSSLLTISSSESAADNIKFDICNNIHGGIFMPVSQEQVLNLLMIQDAVANIAEDVAGLIYGRKMAIPSDLHEDFKNYLSSAIKTCEQAAKVISELSQVLESGFSGSVQTITQKIIADINDFEGKNDVLQRNIRNNIFLIEDKMSPLNAMFLYKVIQQIGSIADHSRRVGTHFIIMVSR